MSKRMKTLLIIRHAKSSWSNATITDFDRPLNERGKHDAPAMAKKIKSRNIEIDTFISSPAKRAKKTAIFFMDEFKIDKKYLILAPSLYEAGVAAFYETIASLKDSASTAALFAHNPGVTDFVNSLNCYPVHEMPTCGVFALQIKIKKWMEFKEAGKEFLFFDYPKNN